MSVEADVTPAQRGIDVSAAAVVPVQSGLAMLGARYADSDVDSDRLLQSLFADEWTWWRWRGVKKLAACQALALHHHLDPDKLGLLHRNKRVLNTVADRLGGLFADQITLEGPSGPLAKFFVQYTFLADYIKMGSLRCVDVNAKRLADSKVTVEEFTQFIRGNAILARPAHELKSPSQDGTPAWKCSHVSNYMNELTAASTLWRTVTDGGTYVLGDVSTEPNVTEYLVARGVPKSLASKMATILRDDRLPKGRKPKRQ